MKCVWFPFLLMISTASFTQSTYSKFGDITTQDFAPTKYDSSASSVILFDRGKFDAMNSGLGPIYERHVRVKILKREDFKRWGNYKIGNHSASISKIKAATYYIENGKIISSVVEKNEVNFNLKDDEQLFGLKNLKVGCVIELGYIIKYNRFVVPWWVVQDNVPVLVSEFLSNAGGLTYLIDGGIKPTTYDEKYKENGTFNRWVFKDVPALKIETLMPPLINYVAKMRFWYAEPSWDDVRRDFIFNYKKRHGDFIFRPIRRDVDNIVSELKDSLDVVKAICGYMKNKYQWSGESDFLASNFETIYNKKEGTSGDLNTMLFNLLEQFGFKPQFVLLSTKANGSVYRDLFSEYQFNYIVSRVVVAGKEYFLDATNPALPFNVLPDYCNTSNALLLSNQFHRWIVVRSPIIEKTNVTAQLTITPYQTLKGTIRIAKQGYDAYHDRKKYNDGRLDLKKLFVPDNTWTVDSSFVINADKTEPPLIVTHHAELHNYISGDAEKIFLNPYVIFNQSENPLPDDVRLYPIEFPTIEENTCILTFTVPDGYKVESLPVDQSFSLPDKSMSCSFKTIADKNRIVVVYSSVIQKAIYSPFEYNNLRQFYDFKISKQNVPLILVRIDKP